MKLRIVKFLAPILVCAFSLASSGQTASNSVTSPNSTGPDKAYLQLLWDGWSTLDPNNVAKFYASGAHTFFDIAPLKYDSWQQYSEGVTKELADYKTAKFMLNNDLAIHPQRNLAWVTATVNYEMAKKAGNVEKGDMRWTAVLEEQNGNWMIVHEHVSMPLQ